MYQITNDVEIAACTCTISASYCVTVTNQWALVVTPRSNLGVYSSYRNELVTRRLTATRTATRLVIATNSNHG
jgi:hypothetical protein